ncbi:Protein of unknown function [Pyronema omphalodes CBS 100304]|uniref:Uncharacterized protein n=1 Tax=Pyronema omphalodes (strain CBS 100304) TaxID=1076935 RepID=U4L766_PYROM|nr:Protein of unknown function [Pyronema omphalodes CBS 100304]
MSSSQPKTDQRADYDEIEFSVPDWFTNQHASLFSRMWEGIIGRKAENGEVTLISNPEILDAIIASSKRSAKVKEALKGPSATMARQKVELEGATNLACKYLLRYFTLTDHLAELLCEGWVPTSRTNAEPSIMKSVEKPLVSVNPGKTVGWEP